MLSWIAMERTLEQQLASDAALREKAVGRPMRADAQRHSDAELLAKLHFLGTDIDRALLEPMCRKALSAQEIAEPLLKRHKFNPQDRFEEDWIWICLDALWQRWFPDEASFELLDDRIQAGYQLLAGREVVPACRTWLEAWRMVLHLLDKGGMRSIQEFDERFGGTQSLYNWIQDLEDELWNAGIKAPEYLTARIALCEEAMRRFPSEDDLMTENRRRHLADSYFYLGDTAKADALYREWLNADPGWGWGWIGWSDCYGFFHTRQRDMNRAEEILWEGLAIAEVRDRMEIAARLADLCEEQGRGKEAAEFRRQATERPATALRSAGSAKRRRIDLAPSPVPVRRQKVGRNEPCPCGSGKKYKKCCGA